MPKGTKIATCCYCGTRAALVLKGTRRHELACSACGAPLHNLKQLPRDAVDPDAHRPAALARHAAKSDPRKRKKKKRKSLGKRFFEEAFDLLEDILD